MSGSGVRREKATLSKPHPANRSSLQKNAREKGLKCVPEDSAFHYIKQSRATAIARNLVGILFVTATLN
jgi:hypothetical protein